MTGKSRKAGSILTILLLAAVMISGCGQKTEQDDVGIEKPDPSEDASYIQQKGILTVGVTDFAPLDYRDGDAWTGFDAEMATLFAEELGVDIEFREIDWDKKTELLEKGDIDLIWNGMTRTEELERDITCSDAYLSNAQVIVMESSKFSKYPSEEECAHLLFACEKGSAAEAILHDRRYRYDVYDTQMGALESVMNGEDDAAVIDMIMAASMTGAGTDFDTFGFAYPLNEEVICVGLRKGSDLEEKLNVFLAESLDSGAAYEIADRYGIRGALIE